MVWLELDSLESVAERRMEDKIKAILDKPSHPLHDELRQPRDRPTEVQNGVLTAIRLSKDCLMTQQECPVK